MKLEKVIAELKKNPDFARAYEDRAPEFDIARAVIRRRLELGWTQRQLAEKVGTKQGSISRLENASGHPSFSFIKRVAKALGVQLHVSLGEPPARPAQPSAHLTMGTQMLRVEAVWPNVPLRNVPWPAVAEPGVTYGLSESHKWELQHDLDLTAPSEFVEAA